jgi:hypothetical protein
MNHLSSDIAAEESNALERLGDKLGSVNSLISIAQGTRKQQQENDPMEQIVNSKREMSLYVSMLPPRPPPSNPFLAWEPD